MVKKRKSKKQLEKDRDDNRERMSKFAQKKSEEQTVKDSLARQQALEQLGITQEFNYADHAEIYNYADHAVAAPIEIVDASIPPPKISIEKLGASHILPSETVLCGPNTSMRSKQITSMRSKQIMLAHCAKRSIENLPK